MARMGMNMKLTVDKSQRDKVRAFYGEALGCSVTSPAPDLDLYRLEDGFQIGVYFAEAAEALAEADQPEAPWLEFLVEDTDKAAATLSELGVPEVDYRDKAYRYYRAPGGPVFRLAKRP
jgi:hypothetical protein